MSNLAENKPLIPEERIASKILLVRGEKIILDIHLSDLYGIETRALKQAVKRNIERFPNDFMFELTEDEINNLVSQNVIPSKSYLGGAVAKSCGIEHTRERSRLTGSGMNNGDERK